MSTTTTALDELRRIAKENEGTLTAEAVVAEAANEWSPLHGHFEWDVETAAHEYRLEQARSLIRSVQVVLTAPDGEDRRVRAFVHTAMSPEGARAYRPIEDVAADTGATTIFLEQLEREWMSFRRKWRDYESALSDLVLRDLVGDDE